MGFWELRKAAKDRKDHRAEVQWAQVSVHMWRYQGTTVVANTKSEARARLKVNLGLPRLPVGAVVEKVL